jgi:cation transport ATPase
MTHTYNITGITCDACIAKVKSELLKLSDITTAEIRKEVPQATITMQKHIPTTILQQAISKAGNQYTITDADTTMHGTDTPSTATSFYPIVLIFAYITGISLLAQKGNGFDLMKWMSDFMAGFFLVFSFFKLMNLKGFAEGYSTYDVIAKRTQVYGLIYPFIELGLGIAYLLSLNLAIINIITIVIMGISSIGVIKSLINKSPFQCACLGTVIKLPLSKVTLFEDLLMVIMSIIMLIVL